MKQKTAMQEIEQEIKADYELHGRLRPAFVFQKIQEMKPKERQQIVDAFTEGYNSGENKALGIPEKSRKQFEDGEQYYKKTYE